MRFLTGRSSFHELVNFLGILDQLFAIAILEEVIDFLRRHLTIFIGKNLLEHGVLIDLTKSQTKSTQSHVHHDLFKY